MPGPLFSAGCAEAERPGGDDCQMRRDGCSKYGRLKGDARVVVWGGMRGFGEAWGGRLWVRREEMVWCRGFGGGWDDVIAEAPP